MKNKSFTTRDLILLIAFTAIILIVLDQNGRQSAPPAATSTALPQPVATVTLANQQPLVTDAFTPTNTPIAATADKSPVPLTPSATFMPLSTNKPQPTNEPDLQITPISGDLYDVVATANALNCPDSRCKVLANYKKNSVVIVTGLVDGTTYKNKKTRVWVQIVAHDGSRIYIHAAFVAPHKGLDTTPALVQTAVSVPTTRPVATAAPVSPVPRRTPTSSFVCPSNCEEARRLGLSAEQAGQCPNLDGNRNGLACYGS